MGIKGLKLSNFIQWRINIFLYITMGWWLARSYLFLLGRLYFFFNKKERQIIRKSVNNVLGRYKTGKDMEGVVRNVFKGIFSHYYEKMFIAFEKKEKITEFFAESVICNDLIKLRRSLLKGKGVIVITGHYGAIEYIPPVLGINDFDISMIAKFKTDHLKNRIFSEAGKYNVRFIDGKESGNVLKRAVKELKENRILITQCDEIEEWRPSEKNKTSFLGSVTGLDRTINIIQKRTGAEVVFALMHRYNLKEYRLLIYSYEDMLAMLGGISNSSVGEVVLKFLEQFIYFYPEQWYQWKKYPVIAKSSFADIRSGKAKSLTFLQPEFAKIL